MNDKTDWFVGRWETESSVILEISNLEGTLKVRAFDKDDGEEIVVSNTTWDGKFLRFETFVRSTKYRTRNCLHLVSKTKFIQELTFWETWRKLTDQEKPRKRRNAQTKGRKKTSRLLKKR